jgi:eukaryotic-like serine/threonine-protein kinase
MSIDPKQVQAAFLEAVQAAAAERPAILDRLCGKDAELRRRVELLLCAHDDSADLPPAGGGVDKTVAHVPSEQPGTVVAGRYKLLEEIGEGGMGTVWVAEQTQPVRRKVALKLIKPGMDSKSVLARFEAERQALAVMDHPNIAKVLDGGLTETGRPFFVMEYVKGVPITDYCDATRLSVPERLKLFVDVCHAVQHAHQKGIIHRDLKPSNILVAPYDGRSVPKVIDFGLAKAINQSLTERTLHTAHEAVLGTPLYMSPEQALLNNLDVDTRSDLYSLGVLLYELLTGTTPLEKQRFKEAAWDEVRRIIREEEPPRPSTRLSSSEMLPALAAGRQMEPARLTKMVRGELDWIVMKALEKDRTRRYESANIFALDVQRFLAGEVVLAAPPSASYLLRKFVRRHRTAFTWAASIIALLILAAGFQVWQVRHWSGTETIARDEVANEVHSFRGMKAEFESEQLAQAEAERRKAEDEKRDAQSVRDFLENLVLGRAGDWTQADSLLRTDGFSTDANENPTVRELLDRAAKDLTPERIDARFPKQPLVQAEILKAVGLAYRSVGEYERAIGLLNRSAALYRKQLGHENIRTLDCMNNLALAYQAAGKPDLALPQYRATLKVVKAKLPPGNPYTLVIISKLAEAYLADSKPDLALPLLDEACQGVSKYPGFLGVGAVLLDSYARTGKTEKVVALAKELLADARTRQPADSPELARQLATIAVPLLQAKAFTDAEPILRECLAIQEKTQLDEWTMFTIKSMLGGALLGQKKYAQAEPLLLAGYEGMKQREAKIPPLSKVRLADALERLVMLYDALEKKDEAARWRKELEARKEGSQRPELDKPRPVASPGTPGK